LPAELINQPQKILLEKECDLAAGFTGTEIEESRIGSLPLIEDDDLIALLRRASNEMLAPLVEFILKKGRPTSKLEQTKNYVKYHPNHQMYVNEIVAEIQRYGANDIASFFRGGNGVRYSEIVRDVAKKHGVKHLTYKTEKLETEIIETIFWDSYTKLTAEQRMEVLRSLKVRNLRGAWRPLSLVGFHAVVGAAGFSAYQMTVIVANGMAQALLGHGLSFVTNWTLVKSVSLLAGPPGLAFAAFLTANMVAGPAYRVTIPCVVEVARIRQHLELERRRRLVRLMVGFLIVVALASLAYFFLFKR
jgi:uncharacterized protein YaaW (UPF0174 family)